MDFLSFNYGGSYVLNSKDWLYIIFKVNAEFPMLLCVVNTAALLAFNHSRW